MESCGSDKFFIKLLSNAAVQIPRIFVRRQERDLVDSESKAVSPTFFSGTRLQSLAIRDEFD